MNNEPRTERRRSYRVHPSAALARVRTGESVREYSVRDLSLGGVAVEGNGLKLGCELEILLSLPGHPPVLLCGRVVRSNGHDCVGVAFDHVEPEAEDIIEDTIAQELIRARSPVALVADSSTAECKALGRSLNALGYRVIGVRTPLEVIAHLQNPDLAIDTVVLGAQLGSVEWGAMAAFLSDDYPQIRRILVARGSWRKRNAARGLVHAIVAKPWSAEHLAQAMHRRETVN